MKRSPITSNGVEKIREQLKTLKTVDRPGVIKAIAEARAHGDLSENAEYHAARERQGLIEARIAQLESALSGAQIIDVASLTGNTQVVFGATVELLQLEAEEKVCYQIVGEAEADAHQGLISVQSPVARALLGRKVGDVVAIQTPGGQTEYEIVDLAYR